MCFLPVVIVSVGTRVWRRPSFWNFWAQMFSLVRIHTIFVLGTTVLTFIIRARVMCYYVCKSFLTLLHVSNFGNQVSDVLLLVWFVALLIIMAKMLDADQNAHIHDGE